MSKRIFDKKNVYLFLILTGIFFQLFYSQVSAQTLTNKWYIDKNATGLKNGTSWVNGWTSFSAINWSSIQPGDTIFISGGITSKTYNEELSVNKSGTSGKYIVITQGQSTEHNGEVIIDRQGNGSYGVDFGSSQYIKLEKISIKNATSRNIYLRTSNCIISRCNLYISSGATCGIDVRGSNNVIEYNSSTTSTILGDGQRDFVQCTSGGNHIFRYNNIVIKNTDVNDHCDGLQFYSPFIDGMTMQIYGNTIWQDNTKTTNAQGIYIEGLAAGAMDNTTWYIYDNLLIAPYAKSMIAIRNNNAMAQIYNNTIYQGSGVANAGFWIQDDFTTSIDNIIIKNNIFYSASTSVEPINIVETLGTGCDVTNNLIYSPMSNPIRYLGSARSLATWNAYSFVGTDIAGNPNFTNISTNDFTVQAGSPAINAGVNLGSPYNIDILGVSRPQGSAWDIGAYQYKSGTVNTDNTPPTLVSASVITPTSIVLAFSEPLELTSAQAKSNYSINNGININSAVLSSDGKKVTLNTTTNSANQTYTVVVSNVKDLAGNVVASSGNSASYSFTQTSTGDLKANVKVFLEGPLDSNVMLTELSGNEFLPSAQPYNTSPWFYGGKEVLGSGVSSATDWVLVELHNAQDPSQIVAKRACLLRNDGRIMEPNGTLGVTFNNLFYGSYYIAVRHRNHLAVMSSSPVLFSPNNDLYDFTNSVNKAYGQNAMMQIASGVYAMYAGDGNGDGIIDDKDRDDLWNSQNGNMGYLNGDFNLDSGVTVKDINDFWNLNHDKKTQVP